MRAKALVWLVVAAARAWDFPWSSTEEGWAPAPEEDPFWVDREPCEADTRLPRSGKRGRALTGNLLRNGDARERTMEGWSVVNGGDGWSAKDGVFKTSFEPNTRRQVVDLLKWVEASVLDSGKVEIVLGEQITETGSRDKYFIADRGPRGVRLALREEPLQDRESRRGDVAPLPNGGEPLRPAQRPRDNEVLV